MTALRIKKESLSQTLVVEAADWLVRFQSGEDTPATRRAFEHWRATSPAHDEAWQRAETILTTFHHVPADIGRSTLNNLGTLASPIRRRALKALTVFAIAAPSAYLAWRLQPWAELGADIRTATGEQKTLNLADGTRLVLNTNSAVDVSFTAQVRSVRLIKGEILITTTRDPAPISRPFIVQTAQGSIRPIGTRFSVRQLSDQTQAAVYEGAIEITTRSGEKSRLNAGEYGLFKYNQLSNTGQAEHTDSLWEYGMLVARNMPLSELLAELSRYRHGMLRCDPEVADLRVSGAFPLRNTDESLDLLVKSRPLQLSSVTRYWVSIVTSPAK